MEMTSKTFEFIDNLNEIKLHYTEPSQHVGECWKVGELQFEITDCKFNNHLQFSVTVSSDSRNINNIAEASIWDICLEHIKLEDKSYANTFTQQLIVTYNEDLHSFEGYRWQDNDTLSLELALVTAMANEKWIIDIRYETKHVLDTLDIARAFKREFNCPMRVEMLMTHAMYRQITDICTSNGFKLDILSIEE